MKQEYRNIIFVVSFFISLFFFAYFWKINVAHAYYACGGGPCNGSYPCNVPYSCNPDPGGVCGVFYNTCVLSTCTANGGFDSSTCATGNQCTPSGTTRSASWSYGACTTNCGTNTRVGTCTCGSENDCSVSCLLPPGACDSTYDDTNCACIDEDPQEKPSVVTCSQVGTTRTAQIGWMFNDTGSGCGTSWGNTCSGNSNSFELRFNGGKTNENATAGERILTTGLFPDWGTYTLQVCAMNGSGENCSVATNCNVIAPVCSVSGHVSDAPGDATCRNTNPTFTSAYGDGADEIGFFVKTNTSDLAYTDLYSPWIATDSPAIYLPVPALATGKYYWNTMSQSTASPIACATPAVFPTGYEINVDNTAPAAPANGTIVFTPNPSCLANYKVTYTWDSVPADTGCAGMHSTPYESELALNAAFTTPAVGWDTNWLAPTGQQAPTSYPGGTTIYGRVKSRDTLSNESNWANVAGGAGVVIPTPTLYPTIHIQGDYIEDTGTSAPNCTAGTMTLDPNKLTLSLNIPDPGVTPDCDIGASSYDCYITIDNQNTPCAEPDHSGITISGSYDDYDSVEWRDGNTCNGAPGPTIAINAAVPGPVIAANAYFKYGTQSWFKTNSTNFINKATRSNIIPNVPVQFDADDMVNPPNNKYLLVGEGGAVLYNEGSKDINLGPNATAGFSENAWYSNDYDTVPIFTPSKFTDYIKSRKQYKTITSLAEATVDGVYLLSGNVTFDNTASAILEGKKIVIVADESTITIANDIILATGSFALIADEIIIGGTVAEVDAIIVGNTVDIGTSALKLKINGNLVQLSDAPVFTNTRVIANAQSPSFFIKFNQAAYLNLLPYLSISMYDWRQVQ